jgi:histidinol-phosphate aminotransferase
MPATNTFSRIARPWINDLKVYEPGKPIQEVARDLGFADGSDILKLASNENELGPSPLAIEAMRRAATDMHRYPDGGAFYLKRALADRLDVPVSSIVVGNGSNELLELTTHVFTGPNTNIVMADRAFVVYRLLAAAYGAEAIAVLMKEHTHDLRAMAQAVTPATRLVFVSNPNNPTGTMVSDEAISELLASLPDTAVLVLDEAYVELLDEEMQPDSIRHVRDNRNVIVMRTFSKTYGLAGLRIGYAVTPPECAHLLDRVRQPFNVNAMALAAALAALSDQEHVARTREMVKAGLSFFEKAFRRMGLPYVPSVANFMLVQTGSGRRIFRELQQRRVIVRPMDVYGMPEHIRISIGTRMKNERCVAMLEEVLSK